MFDWLVEHGPTIELGRVHRFTEPWERDASLALRVGDTDALNVYQQHGRLHRGVPAALHPLPIVRRPAAAAALGIARSALDEMIVLAGGRVSQMSGLVHLHQPRNLEVLASAGSAIWMLVPGLLNLAEEVWAAAIAKRRSTG